MVLSLCTGSRYYEGTSMNWKQKFMEWWEWHRAFLWLIFTTFPMVWVSHPEFQAMLPAKLVSYIAPFMGGMGFISEMVTQLNRRQHDLPNDMGKH